MTQKTMILVSGSGDTVAWFRIELLQEFIDMSYKVYVLAPDIRDELKPALLDLGVEFIEIKLHRKGFNIFNLCSSIIELQKIFRSIQPDLIFSYTHKAIIAASTAARFSGFSNTYSLITGTGHIFDSENLKQKVLKNLGSFALRLALNSNKVVFFQNPDDRCLFEKKKIVNVDKTKLVNGSGVNLQKFTVTKLPSEPIFLCMARLIKSKGILEFAQAAQIVKSSYPNAKFLLYGYADDHPDSINEQEIINEWKEKYGG